ncbi:MAG: hypothetical protein D6759_15825, partial [Chloroflexi bacterium]
MPRTKPVQAPPMAPLFAGGATGLRIEDASGNPIVSATITSGQSLALYAMGLSGTVTTGYEVSTWTLPSGVNGTITPLVGISTTFQAITATTAIITATAQQTPTLIATATLIVVPGPVASLVITESGGGEAGDKTLLVGESWALYAAAYDANNNLIAGQAVTWSVNGGIGTVSPTVGPTTTFQATTTGLGSVQAQASTSITDATGTITATGGPLDHFAIAVPPTATAGLGFSTVITAQDAGDQTVLTFSGPATLTTSDGLITPTTLPDGSFSLGVWTGMITLTYAGPSRPITVTGGGVTSTAFITIEPGSLDHIIISPSSTTVTAGQPATYTAEAFDAYDNSRGDVTAQTTFTIAPASGGSFVGNVVTPTTAATWTVTGTHSGKVDTATLTVQAAALTTITVSPDPAYVWAGHTQTFTASGTDAYGNPVPVTPTWATNGGTINSSGLFTAQTTVASGRRVTATQGSVVGYAVVNITPGPLHHFALSPITSPQTAGVTFTLVITAQDEYNNVVTSYVETATLTDSTGTISPTATGNFSAGVWSGSAAITRAQSAIVITVTGKEGKQGTSNAFDVVPAALDHIVVSPATAVISAGEGITYTAEAFDVYDNSRGDVTAQTVFTIPP